MGGISEFQFNEMLARVNRNKKRTNEAQPPPGAVTDEINELHYPIIQWCKEQVPEVPYIRARSDKQSTIGKGAPDFTIVFRGKVFLFECKSKTGRESPDQIAWKMKAENHQVKVHTIYSMAEFYAIVGT